MPSLDIAFYDNVLDEVNDFITAAEPERGGALMGPVRQSAISLFLPDRHGAVTGVTYTASPDLRRRVAELERANPNLELKGIVHSHPAGMDHPSGGDHRAYATSLQKAPWLPLFIGPIVTRHLRGNPQDPHRIQLASGWHMSVYAAEARANGGLQVGPAHPRVIPFHRDTAVLAARLGATLRAIGTQTEVDGALYAAASLRAEGVDITALFPVTYPTAAPLILLTPTSADCPSPLAGLAARYAGSAQAHTVALPLQWSLNVDEDSRLAAALDGLLVEQNGRGHTARPTESPAGSSGAGDDTGNSTVARDGLRARLDGAAGSSLQTAHVLIVGLGSGGSQTAEALARASVERFTVIDPDQVGPENLSRSVYQFTDIGTDKTRALAARLAAINPAVQVRSITASLDDVPDAELKALVDEADLVIAATDDPKAQLRLNHLAWTLGVPAVFGGVYARGQAGEVIFTVPGQDKIRCYRCATSGRRVAASGDAGINYGTGQLNAEPALGADISHVVTASVKIAIGLLELSAGDAAHSAGNLVATALANSYQFLILSTVPGYHWFPRLFGDIGGQHGYQSVWMSVTAQPDCPTCGTSPLATNEFVTTGPDLAALRPIDQPEATDAEPEKADAELVAETGGTRADDAAESPGRPAREPFAADPPEELPVDHVDHARI
jgi:hypothetical protein